MHWLLILMLHLWVGFTMLALSAMPRHEHCWVSAIITVMLWPLVGLAVLIGFLRGLARRT